MSNWDSVKEDVLVKCKRYCCYCEKYKGRDIEVHHIVPRAKGGKDTFDNAIPLCFDCHSEIGSYNSEHPKGNSFRPNELKRIRDAFYVKVEHMPRKPMNLSGKDVKLLSQFKQDYTDILEYCVRTDISSGLVDINLSDEIYYLHFDKWSRKRYQFESVLLNKMKDDILSSLEELRYYLSDTFLRVHEGSGQLIFRNQSWEEGCRLRDDLRPNSIRIRSTLSQLLDQLYSIDTK